MLHDCDCQSPKSAVSFTTRFTPAFLLKSSSSAPGLSKARGWEAEVRPTEALGRSPGSENGVLWPPQPLPLPHPSLWSRHTWKSPWMSPHSQLPILSRTTSRPRRLFLAYVFLYLFITFVCVCVCLFVFWFCFLRKMSSWLRCLFSQSPSVKCPACPGGDWFRAARWDMFRKTCMRYLAVNDQSITNLTDTHPHSRKPMTAPEVTDSDKSGFMVALVSGMKLWRSRPGSSVFIGVCPFMCD